MPDAHEALAAAAVDAATASRLERIAANAQTVDNLRETLLTLAREKVAKRLGDDAAFIAGYEYQERGNEEPDRVIVELAGVKLRIQHRGDLHALVTCPLCNQWDQIGRDTIYELADLGDVLTHATELYWHETPDSAQRCNGLRMEPKPEEREQWRVDIAKDAEQLYRKLNAATDAGYRPAIFPSAVEGFVIVGKRIGDRYNAAYDQGDDEEPF